MAVEVLEPPRQVAPDHFQLANPCEPVVNLAKSSKSAKSRVFCPAALSAPPPPCAPCFSAYFAHYFTFPAAFRPVFRAFRPALLLASVPSSPLAFPLICAPFLAPERANSVLFIASILRGARRIHLWEGESETCFPDWIGEAAYDEARGVKSVWAPKALTGAKRSYKSEVLLPIRGSLG
ncbi:hypothetical protein L596_025675 [Steinernema carpocapsae]|uniref:Uncharacterized protein n=1 Tax=Steinernema carpocapsae TaxID=34508 RepID=A0A4V5ZYW3_STECR|nr:hypothetical protein L596_025675 [Steinernema carpocapsae]